MFAAVSLIAKLAKDFVVFYVTQMFFIQFSLFCQLASSPLKIRFTIILSYTGGYSERYVVFRNSGKNFICFLISFMRAAKPLISQ